MLRFTLLSCLLVSIFAIKRPHTRVVIAPIGENQKTYCGFLANPAISVLAGVGPAGCGKTVFACNAAVAALSKGDIDKMVITRPIVSVDEDLGFLPGTIAHKMDPWLRPIFDSLGEFYSPTEISKMMESGVIEIAPLAYMRGRTFKRTFVIADEMQNSSINQMLMILTRIGAGSKIVITGDLRQSDRSGANGLADFYARLKRSPEDDEIKLVEFGSDDIQRSKVVSTILAMYEPPVKKVYTDAALIPKDLL
jgi:phosphate starvation-inducible PhoH-like protein